MLPLEPERASTEAESPFRTHPLSTQIHDRPHILWPLIMTETRKDTYLRVREIPKARSVRGIEYSNAPLKTWMRLHELRCTYPGEMQALLPRPTLCQQCMVLRRLNLMQRWRPLLRRSLPYLIFYSSSMIPLMADRSPSKLG